LTNTDSIFNSRQDNRIAFAVTVDGELLTDEVESVSTFFEVNGIPGATIILTDGDMLTSNFELSSQSRFYPGKTIEIKAGYQQATTVLFKGMIIRHSIRNRNYISKNLSGSSLTLECRHCLVKADLSTINTIFHHTSDSDVLSQILKKYGLSNVIDKTDHDFPELVQYRQTDWNFILQRAAANGFVILPGIENVFVGLPAISAESKAMLRYGKTILDLDAELDAQYQVNTIEYHAWDSDTQETVTVTDNLPEESAEITAATGYVQSTMFHTGDLPELIMQRAVNAQKHHRNLAKKRGRVRCEGTSAIQIGDVISLSGTGSTFDGKVLVTGIRHSLASGEWITDLQFGLNPEETEYAGHPAEQKSNPRGLYIGTVLQIENDPKSSERILVRIPSLNDREGIWARLSVPDAGEGRGWTFWPDVNDEVIIGFLQSDPGQPVVLGRLHSSKNPSPYPAENKNAIKGLKTRSGLELVFDDDESSMTLKTQNGNTLKLNDKDSVLEIKDQHNNSIILSDEGIKISSGKDLMLDAKGDVKIKGKEINVQASSEVSIAAKTGLSFSTNAVAKIKGNLIKLN